MFAYTFKLLFKMFETLLRLEGFFFFLISNAYH